MPIIRLIALILVKKQNTKYIGYITRNVPYFQSKPFYSIDKTMVQVDLSIDGYEILQNETADVS